MTVQDVLSQVEYIDGKIKSKSTGTIYEVKDFSNQIADKLKWTKKQQREFESHFTSTIRPQSENSEFIEKIIDKYQFRFSDGVYFINNHIMTIDEIYRLFWKEERLLPTETDSIIENVEKISEPEELQYSIYEKIKEKAIPGKSKYLQSLDEIYENKINFRSIMHNILVPNTRPLFHIFYDDGVGGTGKSTLLEVLTMCVGERFVSNVLLDQFGNRFIFSNMLGKYLNIGDDNGKNDELQNVGTLKSIITGNRVTIDRKNIQPIEVRIFAKQLFATNILPYIDFTDGGIMRRLNIIPMNKVIPKKMKLPAFNAKEIGNIIYEVMYANDLTENNNELAITTSPLYRFYDKGNTQDYNKYRMFCEDYGFRKMNIINFEVKSKFIHHFRIKKQKDIIMEDIF